MTSISVTHNCVQIHFQTPTHYRLWGVTFMFPNLIFSPPKSSFQWVNSLGRRCPARWQCQAVSPLPGWDARAGALGQLHPEPSAGAGALSKPHKEGEMVNSIMGRQKCLFSFSFMVSCHEFGWNCFLDGPQTVLGLCCSTFTPTLIK